MGSNGSGKTHVIEAIHILAGGKSVYNHTGLETGDFFEGWFQEEYLTKSYTLYHDGKREFFSLQGKQITKPKYQQALPFRTVLVSPFDMNLLYFVPSIRRDYIDNILERSFEQFRMVHREYETIMRHRNALLKNIRDGISARKDLDFWDAKFATCADHYMNYRDLYTRFIQTNLHTIQAFLPKYTLAFNYIGDSTTNENRESLLWEYLRECRERDIITGHTHIGPHRHDFGFQIEHQSNHRKENRENPLTNLVPAESYLSRGEMKMLLLGLKVLEVRFLEKYLNIPIILLIDDIFAELDEENLLKFLNSLTTHQTILTSQKPLPVHENWNNFICINLGDM